MKLIIHRGSRQIGGTCVEIRTAKTRVLVDFGMPLVGAANEPFDADAMKGKDISELIEHGTLPDIKGLYRHGEKGVDAILISHSHMDHYGFLQFVNPDIPVYMSKGACILAEITDIFVPARVGKINANVIPERKQLRIGDISVMPYLVDHSAFDALAFLIEADGKRVFYSGDFRGHGRKSALFDRIIQYPPENIDCLLMEGSMLGRGAQEYAAERDVQKRVEAVLRGRSGMTFIFMSSQNIDRVVSVYKACLKTESIFVIDLYTAYILDRLRSVSKHIPQFNWKNIRVKFYKHHADVLASRVSEKLLYFYNTKKIDIFEIKRKKERILMLARDNTIFPAMIKGLDAGEGTRIIYSMWSGYLTDKFRDYCAKKKFTIESVHTSGHATVGDLQAFASALKPAKLIPIHTFWPERYKELFANVQVAGDGEEVEV